MSKPITPNRFLSLAIIVEAALVIRILAANALEWYLHKRNPDVLCLFPDTNIYWQLARCIRSGTLYEIIEWADIPFFALRTPGYPLFLAGCHSLFGENTLAVRLVQAALGAGCVYLVYRLAAHLIARPDRAETSTIALVAALLVAVHPYAAMMSSLILSEAVFEPLMLATLLAVAMVWKSPSDTHERRPKQEALLAFTGGAAAGAAILVRPSWALFLPIMLAIWIFDSCRTPGRLRLTTIHTTLFVLGLCLVMSPWWIRNAGIYGRFVPTALWMGASLYDGLNPRATGASDMTFRTDDPEIWPLDETDQDRELTRRALGFARHNPERVVQLALEKITRYWSPWPNADIVAGKASAIAGALLELPLYTFMAVGLWSLRRDVRVWVLIAGPVLYFCALHAVFASSMRYRLPGEIPALALAAVGLVLTIGRFSRISSHSR